MKMIPLLLAASVLTGCGQSGTTKNAPLPGSDSGNNEAIGEYQEAHRPQFHFSPRTAWMNDPNGMVYYQGEYHLFYQHYPDDTVWGPMHWGHAISKDLVHWEHQPIALYPDEHGWIFSGSAVVDHNNTSGLGTAENPPMVAIFTYHNDEEAKKGNLNFQTQGIAYSLDKGRTWTPYKDNPVLIGPNIPDFRDPKVSWYEPDQKWIMALAVADHISFYSSKNLIGWTHESDFGADLGGHGGVWECPDLIKMPVQGSDESKYVLLVSINPGGPNGGSATQYFVGDFDGSKFIIDPEMQAQVTKQPAYFPSGQVFEDFEGDFSGWRISGDAFAGGPVAGNHPGQGGVAGYVGDKLVNSFNGGDGPTGQMESRTFTIDKPYINFYVGGGNHPGLTAVNLIVDGKVTRSATGGNSEHVQPMSWNVAELTGREAHIQIVDQATGGWGHINVDHIVFADEAAHGEIQPAIWLDYGTDNYAGVTWSNVPEEDGRLLFIGWMSNWLYANQTPTSRWRSAMTVPRSLTLHDTEQGYRVYSQPIEELKKLRVQSTTRSDDRLQSTTSLSELSAIHSPLFELEMDIQANNASKIRLQISNSLDEEVVLTLDRANNALSLDRTDAGQSEFHGDFAKPQHAPLDGDAQNYQLRILQDVSSIEVFVNGGETVMTARVFPNEKYTEVSMSADKPVNLVKWSHHELKSIW